MKSYAIILCMVFIALGQFSHAQFYEKGDWAININLGASFANLRNADTRNLFLNTFDNTGVTGTQAWTGPGIDYSDRHYAASNAAYEASFFKDLRIGFSTAVQIEYFIGHNSSLQVGLQYDQKGIDIDWADSWTAYVPLYNDEELNNVVYAADFKRHVKNNYLSLPIIYKKYLLNQRLFVQAGGYLSYLLSSNMDAYHLEAMNYSLSPDQMQVFVVQPQYVSEYDDHLNLYSETNKIDYGLTAGVGYLYPISENIALRTEMQLNYGLRKIDAEGDNETININGVGGQVQYINNYYGLNSNAKNLQIALLVGVSYKFGGSKE